MPLWLQRFPQFGVCRAWPVFAPKNANHIQKRYTTSFLSKDGDQSPCCLWPSASAVQSEQNQNIVGYRDQEVRPGPVARAITPTHRVFSRFRPEPARVPEFRNAQMLPPRFYCLGSATEQPRDFFISLFPQEPILFAGPVPAFGGWIRKPKVNPL